MPNGGKIEYSLGLATAGFLGPLSSVAGRLSAFIGISAAAGATIAGVWREIQRGGELVDLSNRTGEAVRDLFQLQYAFSQSGVAAEGVAPILQRYRQSLSGIGESGENTAEAFAAIGTSIQELQALDAPAALDRIFQGLKNVDRNTAAGVAGTLFGRGGAGSILQVARDGDSFANALKESADQAERFARTARVFDTIGDTLVSLKLQLRGAFLGIAEELAPAISGVLQSLANRDFQTLGKIAELSLTVAFEKSVNFLATALRALFQGLPDLIKGVAQAGASTVGNPITRAIAQLNASAASDRADAARDPADRAFQQAQAEYWAAVADATEETGGELAREAAQSLIRGIRNIKNAPGVDLFGGENAAALAELLKPFGAAAANAAQGLSQAIAPSAFSTGFAANNLSQANALERVGALFGGNGGASLTDHARQTAANTRESARVLYKVNAVLEKIANQSAGGFANV